MFAGVAIETILIALFHETPEQIAVVVAGVAALVAVSSLQAAVSVCRYRPPLDRADADSPSPALFATASLELTVVLPCHNAAASSRRTDLSPAGARRGRLSRK